MKLYLFIFLKKFTSLYLQTSKESSVKSSSSSKATVTMTTNITTTISVKGSEKKLTATTSSSKESQVNGPTKVEGNKEKLIRCIKNIMVVEKEVGEKEARFREIGEILRDLRSKRDKIDADNSKILLEIYELEKKCPDLMLEEFKEFSYLKFKLNQNQTCRTKICKDIAKLTKESGQLKSVTIKNYQQFKTFAFMKKKLIDVEKM